MKLKILLGLFLLISIIGMGAAVEEDSTDVQFENIEYTTYYYTSDMALSYCHGDNCHFYSY
ncbi:hypothetical protein [Methanococcoides burtonii]|uniref:hypothetical protein n=1 Tax=Methanococcoides burtonii TaxID=29291 RepID=UPI001E335B05|nr:hypothetical protein [Methanococcoides burtonii]